MRTIVIGAALAAGLSMGAAGIAAAEDKITLSFATYDPVTHFLYTHGQKVFMDEVTRLTDGQVDFDFYPAGQLSKASEMLDAVQNGVADIVGASPGYHSEKMPFSGVGELPSNALSACVSGAAFRQLGGEGGPIYESEYEPLGIRPLYYAALPAYSIHMTSPITSVADFEGKKLRPGGGTMELSVQALGGAAVKLTAPDMYDGLMRGTADGILLSFSSAREYSLFEAATHAFTGYPFGAGAAFYFINEARFQSLPENVRTALVEAGKVAGESVCAYMDGKEADAIEEARAAGVEVTVASPEIVAGLDARLAGVADRWLGNLAASGRDGQPVLDEYRKLVGK